MNIFKSPGVFNSLLIIYHLGKKEKKKKKMAAYAVKTPRTDKRLAFYFLLSTNRIAAFRIRQFLP